MTVLNDAIALVQRIDSEQLVAVDVAEELQSIVQQLVSDNPLEIGQEAERLRRGIEHAIDTFDDDTFLELQTLIDDVDAGESLTYLDACVAPDALSARVEEMCKARGWSLHWTARGSYLHLEASELIEAIRGKGGVPRDEAADVLLVLMSITQSNGILFSDVMRQADKRCRELFETAAQPYAGEQRGLDDASLNPLPVLEKADALAVATAGCDSCSYSEQECMLTRHCDACCRAIAEVVTGAHT